MRATFYLVLLFIPLFSLAQIDSALVARIKFLDNADLLKLDTASVPNDALSKKIRLLRSERKGLTPEAIIRFKIEEERSKDTIRPKAFYDALQAELSTGHTGQLLDNAIMNGFRRTYTSEEIDELLRFYKTSAGKKMDAESVFQMVRSIKNAEKLLEMTMKKLEGEKKE